MTRLPSPDPELLPAAAAQLVASLPADPMVQMMALSPSTFVEYVGFARLLQRSTDLPDRVREVVVLTVAAAAGAPFVAAQHRPAALRAGLTASAVDALERSVFRDPSLTETDMTIAQFAAAVVRAPRPDDALFAAVRAVLSARQVAEVLQLIGYYWSFGRITTALDVPVTAVHDSVLNRA